MEFCPECNNLLLERHVGKMEMFCCRCPFVQPVTQDRLTEIVFPDQERKAAPLRVEERTQILCGKCGHNEATFLQMQTRSADEGSTLFYTCVKCGYKWKIN